ncbi:MAG: hypothetical protein ACTSQN_11095 [Candidatus Heimdallarchaeota archaeon]
MVSLETIFLLSFSYLTLVILGFLTAAIFRSFLKKKTTGTLLLFTTYLLLFISRLISEIQRTLQLLGYHNKSIQIVIAVSLIIPTMVSIFLYAFGCRGLIKDSEYVRTLTITGLSFVAGIMLTVVIAGLYLDVPEGLFNTEIIAQTPELHTLSNTFLTIAIIAIQMLIYLRLSISTFILAKNTTEITRKRGFQYIAWGLLIFIIAGLITGATNSLTLPLAVDLTIEAFRRLIFIVSYFMLYIGWTLPDWFRRRLRTKSWFAEKYVTGA